MPLPSPDRDTLLQLIVELSKQEAEASRQRLALINRLADMASQAPAEDGEPGYIVAPGDESLRITKRELAILEAIGEAKVDGKQLAKIMDLDYCGSFRDTLSSLTKRGLLLNTGHGYCRPPVA